jgi:hypothetical protein
VVNVKPFQEKAMIDFGSMFSGKIKTAIEFLHNMKEPFTLTGSRFFGGYSERSDWDFFAEYSERLQESLVNFGFTLTSDYTNMSHVVAVLAFHGIHVQLVRDAALKCKVQEKLRTRGIMRGLTKEVRKLIWFAAYAMIDQT